MFNSTLKAVTGIAALLILAAAPAEHAPVSCRNLDIVYSCSGGGGGALKPQCPAGSAGPQCCVQLRESVRRLCPSGLSTYRCGCDTFCNGAGQCWKPNGTPASADSKPNDQDSQLPNTSVSDKGQRPCGRINYKSRCRNGRRSYGLYRCAAREGATACCRRRLAHVCLGIGNVDWRRTSCFCMKRDAAKRGR